MDDFCPIKAPLTFSAYEGEEPVFSGAVKLNLNWSEYKNGIMKADVPTDNYKPTIIRHNRFAHYGSFSWGIDLMMALRIIISTTIFVWG